MSKLREDHHIDPEIAPLFQKAVSETYLSQEPVCFDMKKWNINEKVTPSRNLYT